MLRSGAAADAGGTRALHAALALAAGGVPAPLGALGRGRGRSAACYGTARSRRIDSVCGQPFAVARAEQRLVQKGLQSNSSTPSLPKRSGCGQLMFSLIMMCSVDVGLPTRKPRVGGPP